MVTLSRTHLNSKKIGIWGLGISGQNLLRFLQNKTATIAILERAEKLKTKKELLQKFGCTCYQDPTERERFFTENDLIIPSPGIAIPEDLLATGKIYTELDLFTQFSTGTTIAITGSLGKTSITTLIAQILNRPEHPSIAGGNIGNGIIETLTKKVDYRILELSSFQLEHAQKFTPNIAIITNIYPNHLDRHKTLVAYRDAKLNILKKLTPSQTAIIPYQLAKEYNFILSPIGQIITIGAISDLAPEDITHIYFDEQKNIVLRHNGIINRILGSTQIPTISFASNWLIIAATLLALKKTSLLVNLHQQLEIPEHRMEHVPSTDGITYINDSKATVIEATIGAVQQLHSPEKTILILGGLSKGADRITPLEKLKTCKHIACFGAEANILMEGCKQNRISTSQHQTLEEAFSYAQNNATPGYTILLSPGGSSYDLFTSYEARGNLFKKLVTQMQA